MQVVVAPVRTAAVAGGLGLGVPTGLPDRQGGQAEAEGGVGGPEEERRGA